MLFIKNTCGKNLQVEPPKLLGVPVAYRNTSQGFPVGIWGLSALFSHYFYSPEVINI